MIHPHSELQLVNPAIGYGVVATRFIPKGTITWVFDPLDQIISPSKASQLPHVLQKLLHIYAYQNGRAERILCWDHGRFVNHSCHPTSLAPGFDLEIAVRDIQPGEQITDDYSTLNLETGFVCACGHSRCRGTIAPGDFDRHFVEWDALIADAFPLIETVEQPLWPLVREQAEIGSILAEKSPIPSCRIHALGAANARC
jgi:hypothetical protein